MIWPIFLINLATSLNIGSGSINGYFSLSEINNLLFQYSQNYSQLELVSIGTTYYNRSIPALKLKNPSFPKILIVGGHHARELISMTQVLYLIDYLLTNSSVSLSKNREIWFVPVLNVDGLFEICEHYNQTKEILEIRKNIRPSGCSITEEGIDLNRNYGYKWGFSNTGSSANPCSEEYRGPSAFSESETQALKLLIENNDFASVVSYHSYGDLYIRPTGFAEVNIKEFPLEHQRLYFEIKNILPKGFLFGSVFELLGYFANGALMDFLYSLGVFTIEIEIGPENLNSFHPNVSNLENILNSHLPPFLLIAQRSTPLLVANASSDGRKLIVKIENKGIKMSQTTEVVVDLGNNGTISKVWSKHLFSFKDKLVYIRIPEIDPGKSDEIILSFDGFSENLKVSFFPYNPEYLEYSGKLLKNQKNEIDSMLVVLIFTICISVIFAVGIFIYKNIAKNEEIQFVELAEIKAATMI